RIRAHNAVAPSAKTLLVPYDDLNGVLERFARRTPAKTPAEAFQKFRLVDHIDAILALIVPRLIDSLLARPTDPRAAQPSPADSAILIDPGPDSRRTARRLDAAAKRDLLLL